MATMRAVTLHRYGEVRDVVEVEDVPVPAIGENDLLVRVGASAVNPGDWFLVRGVPYLFRLVVGLTKPRNPVMGLVVAGTVEQVGAAVADVRPGETVYAEVSAGGFAEYARVPAAAAARTPSNLTIEQAAAVPLVGVTALQAMRDIGRVGPGQRVLINGASGGVGTFAVQIAAAFRAHVTGVCGTGSVDLVRSLGADEVIDYTVTDFTDCGQRWDVILDNVGNRTMAHLRRALTAKGTLIPSANSGGDVLGGLGRVIHSLVETPFVSQRLRPFLARSSSADLAELTRMIEEGSLTPVIDSTYALADAAKALEHYGDGHSHGKVIITVT